MDNSLSQRPDSKRSKQPSVLVIGFNVRPLARSAKQGGFNVLAVDYWGDRDLAQWADHHIAVLQQEPEHRPDRPQMPTSQALLKGGQRLIEDFGPIDHILVSGGLDDHPEAWTQLSEMGNLAGNKPEVIRLARDRNLTAKLAQQSGAKVPLTFEVTDKDAMIFAVKEVELPAIVKPKTGSGGFYTRILRNKKDVTYYASHHRFSSTQPMLIQELINGIDASVSLLGAGKRACTISVNEQLIGLPELGREHTKAYCGNIVPLKAKSAVQTRLASISEKMAIDLGLTGSNGFDFVITPEGIPYFMEINPRFQATIEAIEATTRINLVKLHLKACQGILPNAPPVSTAYCARIIVYARSHSIIPDLAKLPGVVDIPIVGSHANRGDPICTVNHMAATRKEALNGAWHTVDIIYQLLIPHSNENKGHHK